MLMVMLASFLSPSFGLGLVASHDQLAHMSVGLEHSDDEHGQPGSHDSQDHQDAHASIGHLLTHMAAGFFKLPRLAIPPQAKAELSAPDALVLHIVPQPPFRPPRAILPL